MYRELSFRWACDKDLDALIRCDNYAQTNEHRVQQLAVWIADRSCLIGETGGEAFGFVTLRHDFFGWGFIPLICVVATQQRRGFGARLLIEAEARCKTEKLFTSTNASNDVAMQLFARAGFFPSGTIENLDDGDVELVFFKRLRG